MATWVVTGSNRGIGLELVRQLVQRGETVYAACRSSSKELDASGAKVVTGVDVGKDGAAAVLAQALGGEKIDVLVNNAGILVHDSLEALDFDRIREQLEVNTIGPLRLTAGLLGKLGKGSRVAFVSSRAGSIGDKPGGGLYGYRISKTALNMAGANLARDLEGRGIAVVLLHPGFVRTELTGGNGNESPEGSARGLIERIDALGKDPSLGGRFFHQNGQELPW